MCDNLNFCSHQESVLIYRVGEKNLFSLFSAWMISAYDNSWKMKHELGK